MEKCYLNDNVQEIKIWPYFCIKIGDYFFPIFLWHPVSNYAFLAQKAPLSLSCALHSFH